MEQTVPDDAFLKQLTSCAPYLEPFLSGDRTLPEDLASMARFLRRFFVFDWMAMLCPSASSQHTIRQWSDAPENEAARHTALLSLLPAFLDAGGSPDKEAALIRILEQADAWKGQTTAAVLLLRRGKPAGFLFVSRDLNAGAFSDSEKRLLRLAAGFSAVVMNAENRQDENRLQSFVFNEMMDSMNTNLYVTDPKTDRILFMNKTMKRTFGLEAPEGRVCWQVLKKNLTERCTFCPVKQLSERRESEEAPSCRWDEHNSVTGRIYENYDSLMRWTDGSVVHFHQSVDVTEERRLRREARMDDLTELMNRRAGKEELTRTLESARPAGLPVTVCMYDVNELKEVNDAYGHSEGDCLLQMISEAVRAALGPQDYAFRLSGDEFIIVFHGSYADEAGRKIECIRHNLNEERQRREMPYDVGFCCGILEVGPEDAICLPELLVEIDAKMYEQKRWFHIQRAEGRLESGGPAKDGAAST